MSALHPPTLRRLQQIPQIPSVWEGDRRSSVGIEDDIEYSEENGEDCIIWVDGSEGMVRAMDVVPSEIGPEATVRTLLRAIENPMGPALPARPQKIIVSDRQLQFFLRGALQSLNIAVEYAPELPLIDELFRNFAEVADKRPPALPPEYAQLLAEAAYDVWQTAPWDLLADHNILQIKLNQWDVETLYASTLGMLGKEYGVLLYRSLDTLKQFRAAVLEEESLESMENAFLAQDCWFLNYEPNPELDLDSEEEDFDLADLSILDIRPLFGCIHPYEGMRPFIDPDEALPIYVALQALKRFVDDTQEHLDQDELPDLTKRYRIKIPKKLASSSSVSVQVATFPELEQELLSMIDRSDLSDFFSSEESDSLDLRDDLIPNGSFVTTGMLTWEQVEILQICEKYHSQTQDIPQVGEGLPVIIIQTTRPKAKVLIEEILQNEGIKALCFNTGEDPFNDLVYDLGILQMGTENLQLFAEFVSDSTRQKARRQWETRCKKTQGGCGLVIASGVTGAARGNPTLREMMALFETEYVVPSELDLEPLRLTPMFDLD